MKINLGASRHWVKDGWAVLDHRIEKTEGLRISGDIGAMRLPDKSCDIVFMSHVLEHIPHIRVQKVLAEINRVTKIGGGFRLLVPDLRMIATAYVNNDEEFFARSRAEDPSIRRDLGFGGDLTNFVVSPGQDTILLDRTLREFIAGYAHVYAYDFTMIKTLLEHFGFGNVRQVAFNESQYEEMREPLHVVGMEPVWQTMNQDFYKKNGLIHRYKDGGYEINFEVTGFDKNPVTSLIVEANKVEDFVLTEETDINSPNAENYNHYALSMLKDKAFRERLDVVLSVTNKLDNPEFSSKLKQLLEEFNG